MKKPLFHVLFFALVVFLAERSLRGADAPPPAPDIVPASSRVTFIASADGSPAPTFEWFKDGAKIGEGPNLVIETFAAANVGSYTVKATNPLGSAVSPPYVVALGAPPTNPTIKIQIEVKVSVSTSTSGTATN